MGGDGKKYIDVNKLIEAYNRLGTIVAVSQETGYSNYYIGRLLKQAGIQVATTQEINKKNVVKK